MQSSRKRPCYYSDLRPAGNGCARFWLLKRSFPRLNAGANRENRDHNLTGIPFSYLMRRMEESDDSIRRAILSGDKEAYKVLMARYTQIVFRVAYRITGNES